MAARISFADLSDATGIPADLLAAEVSAMQREAPVEMGDPQRVPQTPPAPVEDPQRISPPPPPPSDELAAA